VTSTSRAGKRTRYAGVLFRSFLESRWARAFDDAGIEWRYEPMRFFQGNRSYLPDFWLPELDVWAEVKPFVPSFGEHFLCKLLCEHVQRPVYFLIGHPEVAQYAAYLPTPEQWPWTSYIVAPSLLELAGAS
jgi:hypothetical protein